MSEDLIYAKAGEQIWNPEHTHGIEFVKDVYKYEPILADSVKPLGQQEEMPANSQIPDWLANIILRQGGYDAYKAALSNPDNSVTS